MKYETSDGHVNKCVKRMSLFGKTTGAINVPRLSHHLLPYNYDPVDSMHLINPLDDHHATVKKSLIKMLSQVPNIIKILNEEGVSTTVKLQC